MSTLKVFYNEIDQFCCAWISNLMDTGLITPGVIDDRSIEDLNPDGLRGYKRAHFFAGIAVWDYALNQAGWPDDSPTTWTGSCPCQGFSASGQRGGFSDKRHLWPAWFRLIGECRPDTIFGEQVSSKDGLAWLDVVSADLENEGYAIGAIDTCAASVGGPHIRQRIYFVGQPNSARSQQGRQASASVGYGRTAITASSASELVQPESNGWSGRQNNGDERRRQCSSGSTSKASRMVHAKRGRRNGREDFAQPTRSEDGDIAESAGSQLTNGFWRDAEWIYCSDGKYRPVEPGTFPLASGIASRVGRLRGYGNALCAPQAQAFIEAYMEI